MNYYINHHTYDLPALLKQAQAWSSSSESWIVDLGEFILQWFNDGDSVIVGTSGSTGEPKQIALSKESMRKSAEMTASYFQVKKATNALLCLPVKFIAGKMMVVRALTQGWHLIVRQPSSNPLSHVHDPIEFAAFTPMQIEHIMQKNSSELGKIDVVIIGGAAIPSETESALYSLNNKCFATYGMTETITHIAARRIMPGNDVYDALPDISFETDDESCLLIHAPHIASPVQTNDVVELIDVKHFRFVGRRDNVINSGGIKLAPELLEKRLEPFLTAAFFLGKKKDAVLGEKMVLYIESEQKEESWTSSLLQQLKQHLASYEIPREVIFVKAFERTATHKIIRKNYDI